MQFILLTTESQTDDAAPPNPVPDTSMMITQELDNANEDTSPIPVTIFTALTALIEQYRQQRLADADADPDTPEEKVSVVLCNTSRTNMICLNFLYVCFIRTRRW